nr:hypothetical protein HUO10_005381 [Paraburkholderia busanensis]
MFAGFNNGLKARLAYQPVELVDNIDDGSSHFLPKINPVNDVALFQGSQQSGPGPVKKVKIQPAESPLGQKSGH